MTMKAQQEDHLHLLLLIDTLTPEERDAISYTATLIARVHAGAVRRSGEPFGEHPLAVVLIVAQIASRYHVSQITVSAAFHLAEWSKSVQCRTTPIQKKGRSHWYRLKEEPSDLVRCVCHSLRRLPLPVRTQSAAKGMLRGGEERQP